MKTNNKKGILGIGQLTGIILLLIVIGLMIIVAVRIQSGIKTGVTERATTTFASGGVANESVFINHTVTVLSSYNSSGLPYPNTLSGFVITNSTCVGCAPLVYENGNFTLSGVTITLINSPATVNASAGINNSRIGVSYNFNYDEGSAVYNASGNVMEGTANLSKEQGLLGTIIIFGIILGLVVTAFMIKGVV